MDKSRLRRRMREARRALDEQTRLELSLRICESLRHSNFYRRASVIACYFPFDGEVDPTDLVRAATADRKQVCLTMVGRDHSGRMRFAAFRPDTRMRINQYGIAEPDPDSAQLVCRRRLDIVLVPLVAFDGNGNRLGMGAGYYDRTFHFLRHRRHWMKPRLVGLAFDMQQVADLQPAEWDIPLSAVATETGLIRFARKRSHTYIRSFT
jgi:5-formyltetrahydrofolate cyclo-ligase